MCVCVYHSVHYSVTLLQYASSHLCCYLCCGVRCCIVTSPQVFLTNGACILGYIYLSCVCCITVSTTQHLHCTMHAPVFVAFSALVYDSVLSRLPSPREPSFAPPSCFPRESATYRIRGFCRGYTFHSISKGYRIVQTSFTTFHPPLSP